MATPGYIPGPLVIPETFQLRLNWNLPNGVIATNVLHALVADGLVNGQTLVNDIYDSLLLETPTTTYLGFLHTTTALQFIDVRDLRVPAQAAIQSAGAAAPGTGSGNPLPEEVALVVSLRTNLAGRAHRGRVYLTGFTDAVLDANGHAVSGLTAAAQAFMTSVSARMAISGLELAIGHRGHASYVNAHGGTVAAEAAGSDAVIGIVVRDNVFDSQRRRK